VNFSHIKFFEILECDNVTSDVLVDEIVFRINDVVALLETALERSRYVYVERSSSVSDISDDEQRIDYDAVVMEDWEDDNTEWEDYGMDSEELNDMNSP
jgi:hypothetical protein